MPRTGTTAAITIAVALGATLAACGTSASAPTATPSAGSATTTARTATASPSTTAVEKDPAKAAAIAVVRRWWRIMDQLGKDPNLPIDELLRVSREETYDVWARQVQYKRVKNWRQTGDALVVSASAKKRGNVGKRPALTVDVCIDVSDVDVLDAKGRSIVPADRKARTRASHTVVKYSDGWFIVDDESPDSPC